MDINDIYIEGYCLFEFGEQSKIDIAVPVVVGPVVLEFDSEIQVTDRSWRRLCSRAEEDGERNAMLVEYSTHVGKCLVAEWGIAGALHTCTYCRGH